MAKSAFAFRLGQRVNVPNHNNIQGVIGLPFASSEINPEAIPLKPSIPIWFVRWLADDGKVFVGWFPEPVLLAANAPPEPESDPAITTIAFKPAKLKAAFRRLRASGRPCTLFV